MIFISMSKKSKYNSTSPQETKKIVKEILGDLLPPSGRSLILALSGELGAGKTIFAQGVGEYLGISRIINSPTFVIMKRYDISRESSTPKKFQGIKNFYHFDCYRINSSDEILELGWQDIIAEAGSIILIEWAELIRDIIPKSAVWIEIKNIDENTREIVVRE